METVTVLTRLALKKAIQSGVAKIIIGSPRLSMQILRVLKFKPGVLAMSSAIIPPVLFPPLAPLYLFVAVSTLALGALLYLAFTAGYEILVEKDENSPSPRIIIRKRQPEASKSPSQEESHNQHATNAQPATETATSPQ